MKKKFTFKIGDEVIVIKRLVKKGLQGVSEEVYNTLSPTVKENHFIVNNTQHDITLARKIVNTKECNLFGIITGATYRHYGDIKEISQHSYGFEPNEDAGLHYLSIKETRLVYKFRTGLLNKEQEALEEDIIKIKD